MNWYSVELRGREQHCGTTPMHLRADTLLCAAQMIVKINEIANCQRIMSTGLGKE